MGCEVIHDGVFGRDLTEVTLPPTLSHFYGNPFDYCDTSILDIKFYVVEGSYADIWLKGHHLWPTYKGYIPSYKHKLNRETLIFDEGPIKLWITGYGAFRNTNNTRCLFFRYENLGDMYTHFSIEDDKCIVNEDISLKMFLDKYYFLYEGEKTEGEIYLDNFDEIASGNLQFEIKFSLNVLICSKENREHIKQIHLLFHRENQAYEITCIGG